jgi:hypothetical protein
MRLALLYCLLDVPAYGQPFPTCIERRHLEAALALWRYVEQSARGTSGPTAPATPTQTGSTRTVCREAK